MKYFNELDCINEEILTIKNHIEYLVNNMDNIAILNEQYLKDAEGMLDSEYSKFNAFATKTVLREEITGLEGKILKLQEEREKVIRKILNASKFSVQEIIDLMDKFGAYYKAERVGEKTLIVPQDLYLVRNGYNSVIEEKALKDLLGEYSVGFDIKKSAYSMPMYVKTSNGTKENKQILTAVAGLETHDLEGVRIYRREENGISLNGKVVNLFPHDVLAFLDYMIISRLENPSISVNEAWKEYNGIGNKVLTFSKDDPALEDIYRKTR